MWKFYADGLNDRQERCRRNGFGVAVIVIVRGYGVRSPDSKDRLVKGLTLLCLCALKKGCLGSAFYLSWLFVRLL